MKSTLRSSRPALRQLVCTRCGLLAQPGTEGWRALTAVSHAGPSTSAERAGHEVALDLCRACMREVLKAALGIRRPPDSQAMVVDASMLATHPAVPVVVPTVAAISTLAEAEAFIRASNERLDAWRRAEKDEAESCGCS